jgi:hypothetical protein
MKEYFIRCNKETILIILSVCERDLRSRYPVDYRGVSEMATNCLLRDRMIDFTDHVRLQDLDDERVVFQPKDFIEMER